MQPNLFSSTEERLPEKETQIRLIPMQPEEASSLTLKYTVFSSEFGEMLAASSEKGVSCLLFIESGESPEFLLRERFPDCHLVEGMTNETKTVMDYVHGKAPDSISLHVKGTDFQLQVWTQLIKIRPGSTLTYTDVAAQLGDKKANRAVGNAVGANPIALVIPCHRVIREDKKIGNYRWGSERKRNILFKETAILFEKIY